MVVHHCRAPVPTPLSTSSCPPREKRSHVRSREGCALTVDHDRDHNLCSNETSRACNRAGRARQTCSSAEVLFS